MSDEIQFSPYKLFGALDRVQQVREIDFTNPHTVELHLTNGCNHDCWFCSDRFRREAGKGSKLDKDLVKSLLDDFADMGVKSITVEGGGEPTSHPAFVELMEYAASKGFNLGLTTHGGLIKSGPMREVIAKHFSWVRMSIDSASDATHFRMHQFKRAEFSQVIENAEALIALGVKVLGWSFIVCEKNFHELEMAVEQAYDLGFSYIDVKPLLVDQKELVVEVDSHALDQRLRALHAEFDGKFIKDRTNGSRFRVYSARLTEGKPRIPKFSSCWSHLFIGNVAATGDVFICCAHAMLEGTERPIERERVVIGNIHKAKFREIWGSPKHLELIKGYGYGDWVSKCPTCRFGHHNEFLEQARKPYSPFL